jgi:hypothetical protein
MQKDKTRIWSKKRFSAFFKPYPRFIQKDKTRIWSKKLFQPFLSCIRVLSKGIKVMYLVYLVQFSPNLKLPGIGKMKQNSKLILFHLETDA